MWDGDLLGIGDIIHPTGIPGAHTTGIIIMAIIITGTIIIMDTTTTAVIIELLYTEIIITT